MNTEDINMCDKLSKGFKFGPWEVDWFSSDWSLKLEMFVIRYWTVGGEETDAFSQWWSEDTGFFLFCVRGVG